MSENNKVELIQVSGSDVEIACAAWYSTSRKLTKERWLRIEQRINDMAKPKDGSPPHTVPFEHNRITFEITSDIATHIHFLKHRVNSISAQSARYQEFRQDRYYLPLDWPDDIRLSIEYEMQSVFEKYHQLLRDLVDAGMDRTRAKETARFILPYGTQITYCVTYNFLNFVKFLKLRNEAHAQLEVRHLCQTMLRQLIRTHKFNLSIVAWGLATQEYVDEIVKYGTKLVIPEPRNFEDGFEEVEPEFNILELDQYLKKHGENNVST